MVHSYVTPAASPKPATRHQQRYTPDAVQPAGAVMSRQLPLKTTATNRSPSSQAGSARLWLCAAAG